MCLTTLNRIFVLSKRLYHISTPFINYKINRGFETVTFKVSYKTLNI